MQIKKYLCIVDSADKICSEIGDRLRAERVKKGMTQIEVAKAMNIAQSQYGKVETGKVIPSLKTLIKAAEALGASINKIVYGSDNFMGVDIDLKDKELIERINVISQLSEEDRSLAIQLLDLIAAKKTLKDITDNLHRKYQG